MGVMKRHLALMKNRRRSLTGRQVMSRSNRVGSACFVSGDKVYMYVWSLWDFKGDRVASFPSDLWFDLSPGERENIMSKFRQNVDQRKVAGTSKQAASDETMAASFPALLEYLTDREGQGGAVRQTATITLFAEDGMFKACLNDRQEGLSTWASGESVQDTIEALEGLLASGEAVWRRAGGGKPRGRN